MFSLLSSNLFSLERKTLEIRMPFPSSLPSASSCWNTELRQTPSSAVGLEHPQRKRLLGSLLFPGGEWGYSSLPVWLLEPDRLKQWLIHSTLSSLRVFSALVCYHHEHCSPHKHCSDEHTPSFFSLSITWKQWCSPLLLPGGVWVNTDRELQAGVTFYGVYVPFAKCSSSLASRWLKSPKPLKNLLIFSKEELLLLKQLYLILPCERCGRIHPWLSEPQPWAVRAAVRDTPNPHFRAFSHLI